MLTAPTDDDDFDRDRKIFLGAFPGVKTFQTFDDDRERKDRLLAKVIHVSQNVTWNYISLADKYGLPFHRGYMQNLDSDGCGPNSFI